MARRIFYYWLARRNLYYGYNKANTNEQRNSHKLWLQFGIRIRYQILIEKSSFSIPATGPPTGVARQATSAIVAKYENNNET